MRPAQVSAGSPGRNVSLSFRCSLDGGKKIDLDLYVEKDHIKKYKSRKNESRAYDVFDVFTEYYIKK